MSSATSMVPVETPELWNWMVGTYQVGDDDEPQDDERQGTHRPRKAARPPCRSAKKIEIEVHRRCVPRVLEEGAHDDGEEAAADAPAAEHGREGEPEPPLEPVRHHHVAHVKYHPARELPAP